MFGFPRVKGLTGDRKAGQELIDLLLSELEGFTGKDWEQEDDITLVTVSRSLGSGMAARSNGTGAMITEFEVPSAEGNERAAMERVAAAIEGLGISEARLERLKTAVAEATMNAMEHGNRYQADVPVGIQVLQTDDYLRVRITDRGGGEQIPDAETPDLEAKLAGDQKSRGWGLFLIERMVDEMQVVSDEVHHTVELGLHLRGDDDGDT
jgi:anti-sigma regulatory factor (Ser/Thr protein kinase)